MGATLWLSRVCLSVACLSLGGCRCSKLSGSADSVAFQRCAQLEPPAERKFRAGSLDFAVEGRVLRVRGSGAGVRVVAFTGPLGAALTRHELAMVQAAHPELVLMLGGLGEDPERAKASVAGLVALRVPVLFVAGGADRLPALEAAFDDLDERDRDFVIQGSGLRRVDVAGHSFAVVAGAPGGRYAVDDSACGFEDADVDDVRAAFDDAASKGPVSLLSWAAPAGFGVTRVLGGEDGGSGALAKLAADVGADGGLFAFPEAAVAQPARAAGRKGMSLIVPRLGRTGATRADGGRVASGVARLTVGPSGLAWR